MFSEQLLCFELQFRLGPTLQGREVRVYTNYPTNGYKFNRLQFHPLDWVYPNSQKDDCDKYCRLDLTVAGSYQYYFSCGSEKVSGGYIVVDPVLRVGASNDILPLDRISSQTYLAKGLGPVDTWLSRIRVAKETGYNMIHFTPLQRLGSSGLCYSISDHLELNPAFSAGAKSCTWEDIGRLVETLRRDWNMICISDVVYDHTAADGAWILLHPECGYNLVNSPELRPAWLLDRALWHFSCQMADGTFSKQGLPALIQDERHMTALRGVLWQQVFSRLSLWEFGQVNVDEAVDQFRQALQKGETTHVRPPAGSTELKTLQDPQCRRFGRTVDLGSAVLAFSPLSSKPADIEESCCRLRKKLEELNWEEYRKMSLCTEQVCVVLDQVRSERLAVDGPRLAVVSRERPLCPRYFTFPFGELSLAEEKQLLQTETAGRILAYDAFLRGDPLRRSAEPEKLLRRQLEVRGNDVKLRYGETPEDCPQLWARMRAYTELTARVFSGVCVVDCSSTPLHVTEAMLAAARALRPNFYVMAELQAGSQLTDSVFVNRLGITSVVRGTDSDPCSHEHNTKLDCHYPIGAFVQPSLRPLTPAAAHSMFKDIIPDYSRPMKVGDCSVYNIMVDSTLGSMACCATGSTRGYDELLLHQDSGRREALHYACWSSDAPKENHTHLGTGILAARLALNTLHQQLSAEGFTQVSDVIVVTRHCPSSHQSVVAVVRRADRSPELQHCIDVPPISIPGRIQEVLLEAVTVDHNVGTENGFSNWKIEIREHIQVTWWSQVALDSKIQQCVKALRHQLVQFSPQYQTESLPEQNPPSVILSRLSLIDMNMLLYRCDAEEREDGRGCYSVPCWSPLIYAGLQGLMSVMAEIRPHNDLHHPFCLNLRRGDWILDYTVSRLLAKGGPVAEVGLWFEAMFGYLKRLPRDLVPSYFDAIVQGAYTTALNAVFSRMSSFVQTGSSLVKQLALGSVQMCGPGHSWTQLNLSPGLKVELQSCVSLAAGLPHFSVGVFGCWSRDTFMSFRGLLLLTGRHAEARNLLLLMASSLRYGLIPNLLSRAGAARYNSRDAVWWWLQCVQEFCTLVPQGLSILRCPVSRVFPTDQSEPQPAGAWEQPLYDVIQEVMQRHMQGICFREDNAGPRLDPSMVDEGFNVEAGVDLTTGFVYGGNRFNCGTWMDKMGESDRAHNKGVPATPRDGSAVEIVGLSKSAVRWIAELHGGGLFPYRAVSVSRGGKTFSVSYEDWDQKIQEHFEKHFYISNSPKECEDKHPELVHKRGIYKDSFGASSPWCDYQLRPNFTVAMVVAPELFPVQKAWQALSVAEEKLLGSLGMKTLDPDDLVYRGVYNNNLDNEDFSQAKGFNYHQGPEWLWPLGYFLRAKLYFAKKLGKDRYDCSVNLVKKILSHHTLHLQRSPWKGLPELTNEGGRACPFSCESHAPAMASLLELLYEL
uniref:Glycogen debranching enzyme n=1 Tax=Salarias fasciatus TaxID=181472 RepID=A0A672JG74_SALFA